MLIAVLNIWINQLIPNQTDIKSPILPGCKTMYFENDYALYQSQQYYYNYHWWRQYLIICKLYMQMTTTCTVKMVLFDNAYPYSGTASTDYLYQFNGFRPVFDGDTQVNWHRSCLGGVAVGIQWHLFVAKFCYSDVSFSYNTVPTYSSLLSL
jgi:hypothetical protein